MTTFPQHKRSVKSGLSTRFRFKQGTLVLFHGAGVQHIYFLCPNVHIVTIYCTLETQSICLSTYWINTMKHLSFCGRKHPGDGAIVHTNEVVLLSSLFSQVLIWPPCTMENTWTFLYSVLEMMALCQGFCLLRAAVRFPCFLTFLFCFCLLLFLQQTSNVSATLVLTRPIKGPKEVVLDLEMVTVNNVINFRGSSIIRLTIFVSEHPFWVSKQMSSPQKNPTAFICCWFNGVFDTGHQIS